MRLEAFAPHALMELVQPKAVRSPGPMTASPGHVCVTLRAFPGMRPVPARQAPCSLKGAQAGCGGCLGSSLAQKNSTCMMLPSFASIIPEYLL
jgi:hypothetical protein